MQKTVRDNIPYKYWNSLSETDPHLVGVYPMGGGGKMEVFYRHFFEFLNFQKMVTLTNQSEVLEIGCGNGRWAISIAPKVKKYTGVDFSGYALKIAQRAAEKHGIKNVEYFETEATEFVPDRKYDIIYLSGVTQYMEAESIEKMLDNLLPHCNSETVIIDRSTVAIEKRQVMSTEKYYSIFRTPSELAQVMEKYGYKLVRQEQSYRFLRGAKFLLYGPLMRVVPGIARICKPYSFYILNLLSSIADRVCPIEFEGGNLTHKFLLFKKT